MLLCRPPVDVPVPGIVLVHGGAWYAGQPTDLAGLANDLAARGFVTATISYRLGDEAPWPAALADVKCAVRWMRAHAQQLGVDPQRIALSGYSAGGHLAGLAALTVGRDEEAGEWHHVSSRVQAVVLYAPCVELAQGRIADHVYAAANALVGGNRRLLVQASLVGHVTPDSPPFLTRVGDQDAITPFPAAVDLHQALESCHVPQRLAIVPGVDHHIVNNDRVRCVEDTVTFLNEHLNHGPAGCPDGISAGD